MTITKKSYISLEYDKVLNELANYAKTDQSKKLCLELTPYIKKSDINYVLKCTKEAKEILDYARDIPVEKILNFNKIKEKNEYFVEEELIDIAKTLRVFRIVRNFIK